MGRKYRPRILQIYFQFLSISYISTVDAALKATNAAAFTTALIETTILSAYTSTIIAAIFVPIDASIHAANAEAVSSTNNSSFLPAL